MFWKQTYCKEGKKGFRASIHNLMLHCGAWVTALQFLCSAPTSIFPLSIHEEKIQQMLFLVCVFYCCCLSLLFPQISEDQLLGLWLAPFVKDLSRSSLQKAVNITSVQCPRQASQASIWKSRMSPSSLWLSQGHRSIQLQFEMVMAILKHLH